ncbi:MAG: 50S ribosomal protein L25, partial [Actinomycetes bacterium]
LSGGMVQHVISDLDVRCLAKDLPAFIEVDLKDMTTAHSLHVSELKLPAGVEALHAGTALNADGDAADQQATPPCGA